jgi:predicted RNase H-like HicB family nuclease
MMRRISLTAVFYQAEKGDVVALLEELPGACGQGATIEEAEASLREAADVILRARCAYSRALLLRRRRRRCGGRCRRRRER